MKILEKLKTIKITQKQQKIVILISIFIMMLVLNFLTPLLADDYSYSFGINEKRITNIIDIFIRQVDHWLTWGGRNVAHTLANFFLIYDKALFSILNTGIYILLIYLIYKHSQNGTEEKPLLLILIHLGLYFLVPVFGQNCLWLIGSCNYLWTTVIILLFLLEYRNNLHKNDSILRIIGMLLLGIIAGWTNENTAFGLIVISLLSIIIFKGKSKIDRYKIGGLIGTIIGFIMMIAAPGNYVRSEHFAENTSLIVKLIKRILNCTIGIIEFLPILVIAIMVLISIYIYNKKKIDSRVYIYMIGSFLTVYSMALSPTFPERSWFGVVIFMMIAIMTLIYNLDKISKLYKYLLTNLMLIGMLFYIGDYITLIYDIYGLKCNWEERIAIIEEGKEKGISEFEFEQYYTSNTKSPAYGLSDISREAHVWPNNDIELYYEVDSIMRIQEKNSNS